MEISARQIGEVVLLDVHGEIDLYNAPQLKTAVDQVVAGGQLKVVVNLARCSYLDSTGIGILVHCVSEVARRGGLLKLQSPSASLMQVFQMTRLLSHFDIRESEDDAVSSF